MLKLKYVVPDMDKTFGVLAFAGKGDVAAQRRGGKEKVTTRTYNLFSSVQRADNIEVVIPGTVNEKHFEYDEPVKLVNPRITATGYAVGDRGYTNYVLFADDIVKA